MNEDVRQYLSMIGRRGGRKSKRSLDAQTAQRMVRVREARKAYKRFHARCFWSYDPDYVITEKDVSWIVDQLTKHGGLEAWRFAERLGL